MTAGSSLHCKQFIPRRLGPPGDEKEMKVYRLSLFYREKGHYVKRKKGAEKRSVQAL